MKDLGIVDNLEIYCNGQQVVDCIDRIIIEQEHVEHEAHYQPVALLLLDINMPIMTGFEVVPLVK